MFRITNIIRNFSQKIQHIPNLKDFMQKPFADNVEL